MAVVKYGSIITEIKGKIGGQVFQGGRSGGVMKNLNQVTRRRGGIQETGSGGSGMRAGKALAETVKAWSKLSVANLASWSGLLGVWTFINRFGDVYNGSAFQIFTSANMNRRLLELSQLDEAPIFDAAFDPALTYTDFSLSGDWESTFANSDAIGQYIFGSISRPVNATLPPEKAPVLASFPQEITAIGTASGKAGYIALLGYTPPLGSVFYIKTWTCKPNYPKQQFKTIYTIQVVA